MSRNYDDRIVRMGFENAKFENGAKQTMSTLDKLNEKLKLKGATEGSENVQKSVDSVDFSSMEKAILNIEKRFSTLGIVGMNVINKITNGITGSVAKLEAATLGQIKTGGWNRAMNIANAKFQIEGLGFAWEEVEKAVSYGVKDTAYGLDAAASAASQLAASGVDFKEVLETVNGQELTAMHKSLRAISGVAAMTNSSYEDIARIFTTVAGNGRLMGDQLLQLSSRGMNAAAKLAETLGTTEGEIREMVSRGQIDFQTFAFAMDNAFGDHAKEANKTFTGALGNMKAALSRVGEIFSDPIINKTNTLFISLTTRIDEFKNKLKSIKVPRTLDEIKKQYGDVTLSATAYDEMLKGMGDRTVTLGEDFAKMWQKGIDAFSALVKSVDLGWFDKVVEHVDKTVNKVSEFFDLIKEIYSDSAEEAADGIEDATKTLLVSAEEAQAAKDIILKGMYGSGQKRVDALTEMFGGGEIGAQHAKNVQAYVDSVVAAGWDFDKASIKVEDASDRIAKSQTDVAREVKKAKIKSIIDNIRTTFSNLWTTTKNLGKAAKKITTSILNAFSAVFKIDFGSITDGVSSFSGMLVKLSQKLIISDKTAEKITSVFTSFFEIIRTGIEYVKKGAGAIKTFMSSVAESDAVSYFKALLSSLFHDVTDFFKFSSKKDNPVLSFLSNVMDGINNLVKKNGNVPSKLTLFINNIISAIKAINWKDIKGIAGTAFVVYNVIKLVLAIQHLGDIVIGLTNIPVAISKFFTKIGESIKTASSAYSIASVAKAVAMIAASIFVISKIPTDDLGKAIATLIIIALVIKYLMKSANELGKAQTSFKGVVSAASSAFSVVKTMYSFATLLIALAGAITIMSVGIAIIKKSDAADGKSFLTLVGIMSAITLVSYAIIKMVSRLDKKTLIKLPVVLGGLSAMFVSLGAAVLMMSAALKILSTIPTDSFGLVTTLVGLMFLGTSLILKMASDTKPSRLLAASVTIAAIGGAMSVMILSVSGATAIIASSMAILSASGADPSEYMLSFVGIISALFLAVVGLAEVANKMDSFAKVPITLLAMSVMMSSIGGAILAISMGLVAISKVSSDSMSKALTVLTVIFGGLIVIMYMSQAAKPTQMLAASVMFVSLSAAVVVLAAAVALLSHLGSERTLEAAGAIVMTLVGLGVAMAIAGSTLGKTRNKTATVIGGVLAMSIAIMIISSAIAKIGDVSHLAGATLALIGIMMTIAAIIAVLSIVSKKSSGSGDSILAVGAAFIMISASLLILAYALEKMAAVINAPGVVGAIAVMAGFMIIVGGLAIAAALIPGAIKAFYTVGNAFLKAGIGAALVGAGIFLVCKGIQILAPAIGTLSISLVSFFGVLEQHKAAAIGVGIVTLAIIGGIIVAIVKLGPIVEAIASIIASTSKRIEGTLDKGKGKLKSWVSNLSTKGKATIVALITTLCAAILKASPEVLNTVGQLLIKLLSYLGSITGDVAEGLLSFLINLINGLSRAIRRNSALIAAALWGVFYALTDVVVQILGQLLYMLIKPFSETFAESVQDSVTAMSKDISVLAEEHQAMAEEMAKSNQDYIDSIEKRAKATTDTNEKSAKSFGGLTDATKQFFDESGDSADKFGEKYDSLMTKVWANDYSGAKMPALDKADDNTKELMTKVWGNTSDFAPDVTPEDALSEGGWTEEALAEQGTLDMSAYSDAGAEALVNDNEYYQASSENMDSAQQAIVDSKDETKKAVQENFNEPAKAQIRGSRQGMYDAAKYSVEGAVNYIEKEGVVKYRSALTFLARQGQEAFVIENKISSPSKVYYQNGAYIVEGLVNGIYKNAELASGAMGDLSESLIAAFGDPIGYVSKIASGELVYDPSVRPVFDGSGLYKGASSIDSMIKGQTITVAGLSGRLAADIGTLDHSNADIIAELQAMREDIAVLGDEMADMQVVMDSGALVGSISGQMDRALGRRTVYKGRGN